MDDYRAQQAMAAAIKHDPSDGDWTVWITPSDAAARALRGLEAAGFEVRPAADQGAVEALEAIRRVADDPRFSDEHVGNVARSKLAHLDRPGGR